ncbi:MAG TPA: tetratricopeptide repeat protein [Tepidisphaeraceae bacterium]|nr:tetratricopeptide repeat protein [Tepidisphaeraceae bacterium]
MSLLTAEQSLQVALLHHGAGRMDQAEKLYRDVLSQQPDHAAALNSLGVLAIQTGRPDQAVRLLQRAVSIKPSAASYHCNLGEAHRHLGQIDEAIIEYRQAIRLQGDLAVAHGNLGIALGERNEIDTAIACYRKAISLQPTYADAYANLGSALTRKGQLDEAIAACHKAISLQPTGAPAYNNLGVVLAEKGDFESAIAAYRKAIELKSDYSDAHSNLGNAYAALGESDKAIRACQTAVKFAPHAVQAHWNLAVALLRAGQFKVGWEEYEWRWAAYKRRGSLRFSDPAWDGSPLNGRTILLHAEQGFGDAIQFARCVPLVAQLGGKVIFECPPELFELFKSLPGGAELIASGAQLPHYDLHCPLMSLPRALKTRLDSIPANVPYLAADSHRVEEWKSILGDSQNRLKIGLAWAGKPTHTNDRNRSADLSHFAPLTDCGAIFHSLQKVPLPARPRAGLDLIDHASQLTDFAETAALIANLDLVITVDTSVAHLAGALAKPTWVLLPHLADWRWLTHRTDSPWYPTTRLFRQKAPGDWSAVIHEVVEALRLLAMIGPRPMFQGARRARRPWDSNPV